MMGLTWCVLGVLTGVSALFLRWLSKQYRLNWLAWGGFALGIFLILFGLAWAVGSVLEGVPRSAAMGLLLFCLGGIVVLTATWRYVHAKLEKLVVADIADEPTHELPDPQHVAKEKPALDPATGNRISAVLRILAYGSLVVAFVVGIATRGEDYEAMVRAKFPGQTLTKVNDDPVVLKLDKGKVGSGNYIVIAHGQGYGGPLVIGVRIMDDARVHQVILLENKETPAFRKKVEDANFPAQFVGKHVADDFLPEVDIDVISGATISTIASTEAIREAAHLAAVKYFKLKPTWKKEPWGIGLAEMLILALFVLAFVPSVYGKKPWRYIYLVATIVIVGFYLNAAISISSLSGLAMGYVPKLQTHLIWWLLVVGTLGVIAVTGKNIYCYRICPFYGVEFLLSKVGGGKLKLPANLLKRSKLIGNFLLWASLMLIFLSSHPALGSYEPFAMMFSLNGAGVQWFLLPLALIGAFFMSTYWCRFFCPCGHALTKLRQFRKTVTSMLPKR
jgi:uncharacterized protein with FMN-binding domain